MECKNCNAEEGQVKAGKTAAGSQRYKCKKCGRVYTPKPKGRGYSEETKEKAIKLYMEGNSSRAVGRILGIGKNMCLYWIHQQAKQISEKEVSNERLEVIEMDELYSFVNKKNRIYVITLVSRDDRQIVGFDVAFDKSRERIQNLVDKSVKAKYYYSDSYSAYSEILYHGKHTSLRDKSQTYTVEGINSDLRHYIPALHRRSKCFFRSLDTVKAVLKVFVNAFNNFAAHKKLFPSLKSSFFLSSFL